MTKWIDRWNNKSKYRDFAIKAMMLMPNLLLQKTTKKAKSSEYKEALTRRLALWREGNILDLLKEGETIQNRLKATINKGKKSKDDLTKRFTNFSLLVVR